MTTTSTVFTRGDGGYAHLRIPALTRTPAGTLVAFCEGRWQPGDSGDINIVCRRSTDGGKTWGKLQEVLSQGHHTAGNPTVVTDPASGDLVLLSCRNRTEDTWSEITTGKAPQRRVYVQRSSDDARTWSKASEITAQASRPAWRWYATGPGRGVAITSGPHKGRLVIPCNHTRAPLPPDKGSEAKYSGAHLIYSDDGGRTWAVGAVSESPADDVREDENSLTLLPDGRTLYASCRCERDTMPGNRADARSLDAGLTFTDLYRPQTTITTPMCQGSLLTLPDGRLLYAGPSSPTEREAMALRTSADQGRTWKQSLKVSGAPAAYSSLVLLDKNTVGLLYETGGKIPYDRVEFRAIPLASLR